MEPIQTGEVSAPAQWVRPSRGQQGNGTVFTKSPVRLAILPAMP